MTTAIDGHIEVDDRGVARIRGSRIKVRHIVLAMRGENLTAETIFTEVYPHLSPAQVYAALTYYHDHREQVDAEIEAAYAFAEQMRREHPNRMTREEWERRRAERGLA